LKKGYSISNCYSALYPSYADDRRQAAVSTQRISDDVSIVYKITSISPLAVSRERTWLLSR